ncbi:MAG TPA: C1 family peptidase [Nocardioides sp.]|nr:C1 family peptidase [Nocardioides sp.]
MPIEDINALREAVVTAGHRWRVRERAADEPLGGLGWEPSDPQQLQEAATRGANLLAGVRAAHAALGTLKGADAVTGKAVLGGAPPASFDWRNRGVISAAHDQEQCGSCVSFATTGLVAAQAGIELGRTDLHLSEADQHFCSSHGANCGGWNNHDALGQIQSRGVVTDDVFPYDTAFDSPPVADPGDPNVWVAHARPEADRAHHAYKISDFTAHSGDDRKTYLSTVGPMVCGFTVYEDFDSYGGGVYRHTTGNVRGGHAVLVVGYSDIDQAWICRNSWYSGWGGPAQADGTGDNFFKLGYGECGIDNEPFYGATGVLAPPVLTPVRGVPALIQSRFGAQGNFELVVPLAGGGLGHYWRNNDDPAMPWSGVTPFGQGLGSVDAVTMIQSNYGWPGNLEVVARAGDTLQFFWRDSGPDYVWNGPYQIASGVCGNPVLIQSRFGSQGNFELVVPLAGGGLGHMWRNNDDPTMPWSGFTPFGQGLGIVDAVTMIESNYGSPGNLEIVARAGDSLQFFWRDCGPGFVWSGPYQIGGGATGNPVLLQSRFGQQGNFELAYPAAGGGVGYMWRNDDDPAMPWSPPYVFANGVGASALTMIESNYGTPGNMEVIAVVGDKLEFAWRDSGPGFVWSDFMLMP